MTDAAIKAREHLAALENVRAITIERCAQVADNSRQHEFGDDDQFAIGSNEMAKQIAAAIRALKDKP